MVFQHFNLFNNLTVGANIMLAPVELKKETSAEATTHAKSSLTWLGWEKNLMQRFNHYPVANNNG
ncbi:hypothetical protein NBRC111893_2047 [Lentilactobacillus kosonis]|uniref:Uncharacterized protein n=1 Tax=Lentilactobacillus kosonis TaxID=2810561 RepID=A0A401FNW1_9LACO|nr:hypothetical protein NBRC111893_2047 [Lentilactobacillus kosonis]